MFSVLVFWGFRIKSEPGSCIIYYLWGSLKTLKKKKKKRQDQKKKEKGKRKDDYATVSYSSQSLSPTDQQNSQTKWEFFSIVYACERRRLSLERLHIPQNYHKPLKEPQIESHNTNRMHALPFTRQH